MRTAVVRVNVDPAGTLTPQEYEGGVAQLRGEGLEVISTAVQYLPDRGREVELVVADAGGDQRSVLVQKCEQVFGTPSVLGVVTYISRGTDEDARGILIGFGLDGTVARTTVGEEEVVNVTIRKADLRRVPESRLHTAMESALNCEVQILAV